MSILSNRAILQVAAVMSSLCGVVAMAADEPVTANPAQQEETVAPIRNLLKAKPLDLASLSSKRGGSDSFSDMTLRGVVTNNQAINVTSGGNFVTQGALAGASGFPMLVQNSGSNVLIQNATIINLHLQ